MSWTKRIVVGLMLALPAVAAAQSGEKTLRTAWGHPDLQGVWDFRTITPMERPGELAGKQVLSAEEAAAYEAEVNRRQNRDLIDPAKGGASYPPESEGGVVPYNEFWYDRGSALVEGRRTSLVVDPPDGRIPPLTPEAENRLAARAKAREGVGRHEPTPGGWVGDIGPGHLAVRCLAGLNSGPPMDPGGYNQNVQLFQTADHVVLLNEMIHKVRVIPLDGREHLDARLRQWMGDSRGRWDGDSLVVETTNFLRETKFRDGLSDANLHLIERFTRASPSTLLYEVTVTDPTVWTRPWTYRIPMQKSDQPLYEYACHEGNYGLYNILTGTRAREKAAEEAAGTGSR